ncbi:MAG: hypothetical protein U1E66_12035 [Rhodospirillales bacterium]
MVDEDELLRAIRAALASPDGVAAASKMMCDAIDPPASRELAHSQRYLDADALLNWPFGLIYLWSVLMAPSHCGRQKNINAALLAKALSGFYANSDAMISGKLVKMLRDAPKVWEAYGDGRSKEACFRILEGITFSGNVAAHILRILTSSSQHDIKLAKIWRAKAAVSSLAFVSRDRGPAIKKAWDEYKSVAHFWYAIILDMQGFRQMVKSHNPDQFLHFLALAEILRELGSQWLDPATTWKVPPAIALPAVDMRSRLQLLSDELLQVLAAAEFG